MSSCSSRRARAPRPRCMNTSPSYVPRATISSLRRPCQGEDRAQDKWHTVGCEPPRSRQLLEEKKREIDSATADPTSARVKRAPTSLLSPKPHHGPCATGVAGRLASAGSPLRAVTVEGSGDVRRCGGAKPRPRPSLPRSRMDPTPRPPSTTRRSPAGRPLHDRGRRSPGHPSLQLRPSATPLGDQSGHNAPEGGRSPAFAGLLRYGSDGTRTRDLRRDRPAL